MGGGRGGWETKGGLKHPFRLKEQWCAFQYVPKTDTIHKGGPDGRKEQFGTPCSPIIVC